jgi:hypothetical protein
MANLCRIFGFTLVVSGILGNSGLPMARSAPSDQRAQILARLQQINIGNLPDFEAPMTIDFTRGGQDGGLAERTFGVTGVQNITRPSELPTGIWTMLGIPQSSTNDIARRSGGQAAVMELSDRPLQGSPFENLTVGELANSYPGNTPCRNIPVLQSICSDGTIQGLANSPAASQTLGTLPGAAQTKLANLPKILDVPLNKIPKAMSWPVGSIPNATKLPLFRSGLSGVLPIANVDTTLTGETIEAERIIDPASDPPGENPCGTAQGGNCNVVELKGASFNGKQLPDTKHRVPQGAGFFKGTGPPGFDIDGHDGVMAMGICNIDGQLGTANACISFRPSPFYVFGTRHAFPYFIGPFPIYSVKDKNQGSDIIITALSGLSNSPTVASSAPAPAPTQIQALSNALPAGTHPLNAIKINGNKIALGKYALDLNHPAVQKEILGNGGKELVDSLKAGKLPTNQLMEKYFPVAAQERVRNELMAGAIAQATAEMGSGANPEEIKNRARTIYLGDSNSPMVGGINIAKLSLAYSQTVGLAEANAVERRFCRDKCDYAIGQYGQSSTDPSLRQEIVKNGGTAFLDRLDRGEQVDRNELLTYLPPGRQTAVFHRELSLQIQRAETILLDNPGGVAPERSKVLELAIKLLYSGENASDRAFAPLTGQSQQAIANAVLSRYGTES